MTSLAKHKQTHRLNSTNLWLLAGSGWGRVGGGVMDRKGQFGSLGWDGHVHTAVSKMENQQGPIVEHRKLCSMLCGSLDWRAV